MKWISFWQGGRASYGVLDGDRVRDVGALRAGTHPTLLHVLADKSITDLPAWTSLLTTEWRLKDITLDLPLPQPPRIFCVGRNYRDHVAEVGGAAPAFPSMFLRSAASLVASGQALVRPRISDHFDFEGELAFVVGKPGRHIARAAALDHIWGYTIFNDGSVRDYQMQHSLMVGKNFEASGAMGPLIATADELPDPSKLVVQTRLNGQRVQHSGTDALIFDIPAIVEYISRYTALQVGDVVATGTPEGVGFTRQPPLWLKPRDVLTISITGLGTLHNTVVDEPWPTPSSAP